MQRKQVKRGRKAKNPELLKKVKKEILFTKEQAGKLEDWQRRENAPEMSSLLRDTLLAAAEEEFKPRPVLLLGEIPGGDLAEIKPAMPEQYVHPPFDDLPPDCYALEVRGDSMDDKYTKEHFGLSAPDGFYAFFAPGVMFPTMIAHVEVSDGQFEHTVTLKKVVEHGDKIELRPLNKNHKSIDVPRNRVQIKGGFIRAWNPKVKS